jgi:polyhydroxyalkanoate synthesis regulator phasin
MANFKYKLPERKVGDVNVDSGIKSTVKDINPETGTISWDIEYVPAFDSVYKEFDELRKAIAQLDQKTDDSTVDDIATKIKAEFNRYRTHIRKNYPEAYKKFQTNEVSMTNSGGATFTPGTGAQYATPRAFTKKGKKQNDATKYILKKFGYKLAPSIPNRKSKAIDYKQVMEEGNMYKYKLTEAENDVEVFQQQRIQDFSELERRLDTLRKKLRQAKLSTQRYYNENPKSYAVVYGTDMINDYFNDIETLLTQDQ